MSSASTNGGSVTTLGVSERPPTVTIQIDGRSFSVEPGRHRVSELKALAGIAPADELSQIVGGQLVPLQNDAIVVIQGGEQFVSNPPSGGSS